MIQFTNDYITHEDLDTAIPIAYDRLVSHLCDSHDDLVEVTIRVHNGLAMVAKIESHQEVMPMVPDTGQQSPAVVSSHRQRKDCSEHDIPCTPSWWCCGDDTLTLE
jgi:hypothetical protein